jgi:hypothetical protein
MHLCAAGSKFGSWANICAAGAVDRLRQLLFIEVASEKPTEIITSRVTFRRRQRIYTFLCLLVILAYGIAGAVIEPGREICTL